MKLTRALAIVAIVLLGYGSVSDRWFVDTTDHIFAYEGVLSSEVCGFGVGDDDPLERYGEYMARGEQPPPPVWKCERTFHAALVTEIHKPIDLMFWSLSLLCVVAGLAAAALVIAALTGRNVRRALTIVAAVAAGAAVAHVGLALATEYAPQTLGRGAAAYVAGVLLALWTARVSPALHASR